jgi:hypothetical protein
MSLGISGKGEVAAPVSLFSKHASRLRKRTNKSASVTESHSKFEVRSVVRFLQAEGVSQRDSSQVSECSRPEGFQQKGGVCVVQQILRWPNWTE